eukprot:13518284-Alexandrium_andersonii.AAC.1
MVHGAPSQATAYVDGLDSRACRDIASDRKQAPRTCGTAASASAIADASAGTDTMRSMCAHAAAHEKQVRHAKRACT